MGVMLGHVGSDVGRGRDRSGEENHTFSWSQRLRREIYGTKKQSQGVESGSI